MSKKQDMSGAGLMVVAAMCLGLLLAIGTLCALAVLGKEVPTQLEVVLGALVTGVPAMLAKTYRDAKTEEPAEVEVVNSPGDPVPTAEADVPMTSTGVLEEGTLPARRQHRSRRQLDATE